MKKVWRLGLLMTMITLLVSGFFAIESKAQGSVSLQVFYDELQPYGTWMQHARFGYVWMPRVESGFTPYATNGYWINTEYGNTWVSDYSWGWAPFHYGRWFYDDFNGWIWVPDTEWAPAWVAWRGGGGYYGWAPLMPGFGISVSVNYYHRIPHHYWNFVPSRYITYRTMHYHCVPRPQVVNIINHTTVITHNYTDTRSRTYFTGPSRSEMERTGRTRVDVYRIAEKSRPGRADIDRGTVSLYRPEIDNSRETRERSMPSKYMKENGNGRMEPVESRRGQSADFGRERYDAGQGNAGRQSYRTDDSKQRGDINADKRDPRDDWQKNVNKSYRSQDVNSESRSRNFSNNNLQRENINREQSGFEQRKPTNRIEPGNGIQRSNSYQREHRQLDQNMIRREPAQQSQRMQFEKQKSTVDRMPSGRESQQFQQQRSSPQNSSRSSIQRNEQQFQRGSGSSRSYQPSRSSGMSKERGSKLRE